jgi:hypothetical protein
MKIDRVPLREMLLERTLRVNNAAPVTAAPTGIERGSEIRTR